MPITAHSPAPAHLLDLTRTVSRAGLCATGIDRVERAYIVHLARSATPLFGLVRTRLGFLLLDRDGCLALLGHCDAPAWLRADLLSRLTRRADPARAMTETGLRSVALARALPSRLGRMLRRYLPPGSVYFNVGQTNFNDTVIHGLRSAGLRIVPYVHDTIPIDWPDTQTPKARVKFRRFFDRVDRAANLVLCNSADTKSHILCHAKRLSDADVQVLHPGLPEIAPGQAPKGGWTRQTYFVALGTIEPRKNIGYLLDLWEEFCSLDDPHLVLCGRAGWMCDDVVARIEAASPKVHWLPDLPDPALWALMSGSAGLLFPTRAEGYGFPAIEAATLGCPIICGPLPAFREVLGDYPIYAELSDRYLWREKIEQLTRRRRNPSGEHRHVGAFKAPDWQGHFNRLFTCL